MEQFKIDKFEEWYLEEYGEPDDAWEKTTKLNMKSAWQESAKQAHAEHKLMDQHTREHIFEMGHADGSKQATIRERERIVGKLREWADEYEDEPALVLSAFVQGVADRIEQEPK